MNNPFRPFGNSSHSDHSGQDNATPFDALLMERARQQVEQAAASFFHTGQQVLTAGAKLVQEAEQSFQEKIVPIFSQLQEDPLRSTEQVKKGVFQSHLGQLEYELFIPKEPIISSNDKEKYAAHLRAPAVIVFLHGCEQSAQEIAEITRLNDWAQEHNYYVLYPQQSKTLNPKGCWNWFVPAEQTKNMGQSHLIVNMTHKVMLQYGLVGSSVFVGGMSAGAAQAHILATNYPELFTAAALYAGVAKGLATNPKEALRTMRQGPDNVKNAAQSEDNKPESSMAQDILSGLGVQSKFPTLTPLIVFQGNKDVVVHAKNAEAFVSQTLSDYAQLHPEAAKPQVAYKEVSGLESGNSQQYAYKNTKGQVFLEYWRLEEVGHAWSGSTSESLWASPQGVNATEKMITFFNQFRF